MAKSPGGLDPVEIKPGWDAIVGAKTEDDLLKAIEKTPVLRSPVFHAILCANASAGEPPWLPALVDRFFMVLAAYVYIAHCKNAVEPKTNTIPESEHDHWPPFYQAVCKQLNGKVPVNYPHRLKPSRDIERLVFEIEEVTKGHVVLPEYHPTEGSTWSAVVVMCPSCKEQRVEVFANKIDFSVAPNLLSTIRDGRINNAFCPRCGQARCYPIRVWIGEEPSLPDTVASLTGIFRLRESSWIYLPPPGTPRDPQDERLYEVRSASMLKQFKWPALSKHEHTHVAAGVSIAYGKDDLTRMAEELLTDRSESELPSHIPSSMKQFWDASARNIRSGHWPLVEATRIISETVSEMGQDWPLMMDLPLDQLEKNRRLAICLIRECLVERALEKLSTKVKLKLDIFRALLQKGQLGLADAKLREAQTLLKNIPTSDAESEHLKQLSQLCSVELLDAQGRNLEASQTETEVMDALAPSDKTIEGQILALRAASGEALKRKQEGRLLEALKALRRCVLQWNSLLDHLVSSVADASLQSLEMCSASLSSDAANLANVLNEFRGYVKAQRIVAQLGQGGQPSDEDRLWIKERTSIVRASFDVMNDSAFDELEDFLGPLSERRMWDRSLNLLEQALDLSTRINAWDLAATQAHNMAMLLFEGKEFEQANTYMRRAVDYAERSGNDSLFVQGFALLALLATKRGDGQETIQLATKAIETYARNMISRGHSARPNFGLQRLLARLVLEAVSVGGTPGQAVVLVENLKSLTLVNSLFAERPDQPGDSDSSSSVDAEGDLGQRLEEIRLRAMFDADERPGEREASGIEEKMREIEEERSFQDPRFSQWVDSSDFALTTLAGLTQRLCLFGDRTTFLGIFFDGIDLWTYALWSDGCRVLKTALPNATLPLSEVQARNDEHLSILGNALFEPLIERSEVPTGKDRLVFSSCPELDTLPIAALSFDGRQVVQSFIVNVVQGAGVFEACIRRPFNRLDSLLCLGNPSRPDLPPLKRAEDEVKLLDSQFSARGKEVKLLLRHKATAPAFIDSVGDCNICHLACHAEFRETGGRLMLAPDPAQKDSGEMTDLRILTEVKIRPGALVNLVGCSTAEQGETGAVMIGGLVPAWMLAGASGVVASLWPIEDGLAKTFQGRLYQYILDGSRPDEGLALTQRDCISGKLGDAMRGPEAWAAFQFYGSLIPNEATGFL